MTKFTFYASFLGLVMALAAPCLADEPSPLGEWQVKEGDAHIRILSCNNSLWGFIHWLKQPGLDDHNPDPAKRSRPLLGVPILLGMTQEGDDWAGHIYNSENGKIYSGSIHLTSPNTLAIKGCVLGMLCGGEDWKRLTAIAEPKADKALCDSVSQP